MTSSLIVSSDRDALLAYAQNVVKDFHKADVFWLRNQEGSLGVKEVIEFLDKAHLSPIGKEKLMIVVDFSCVTPQAQNKMLKTIEDTPGRTNFLLLATDPETILNTIKSRCMTIYLPQSKTGYNVTLPPDILLTLKQTFNIELDEKALNAKQKRDILDVLAVINRNVKANCNETHHKDLAIMKILEIINEKNSKR